MNGLTEEERRKIEQILLEEPEVETEIERKVRISCAVMYLMGVRSCEVGNARYVKLRDKVTPVLGISEANVESQSVPRIIPVCRTTQKKFEKLGLEYGSVIPIVSVWEIEKFSSSVVYDVLSTKKQRQYNSERNQSSEHVCMGEFVFRKNMEAFLSRAGLSKKDIAYYLGTRKLTAIGYRAAPKRDQIAEKMDAAYIAEI